ncbi:winged helix-turn-helix domain-containing protein [Agrobacterium rhizogenes]|uniref:winged helix-turn-helix domain-containing protein n=1 Tax=Rhizobium rhizogenes TaxID=359 RepID=UPI001572CCE8|nr:winged helix-turn-helix domain-containing protein [Rhizobium rhizogenes]NTF62097.1 winged helix-turn-helix domain-containing protein [Rhizobium rhizogenes]
MAKSDILFVTDAQCAERLGLTTEQFKIVLPAATKSGFPMKDPLFADRRYWPAVRAWLDHRYGLGADGALRGLPSLDGAENW